MTGLKTEGETEQRKRREAAVRRTQTPEDEQRIERAARVLAAVARHGGGPAYPMTDDGNVLRFRAVWGDEVRWCPGERGGHFWWFDLDHWVEDRSNEVPARVRALVRAMEEELAAVPGAGDAYRRWVLGTQSVPAQRRILEGLRAQVGEDPAKFDAPEWDDWLNTPSSMIHLTTGGAAGAPRPEYLLTQLTGVHHDPEATCPRFREAVDLWTCHRPELAVYLQKVLGASLLPGAAGRLLVVLLGASSANGKSTLGEVMRGVLGDYAGTLAADALMEGRFRASHDEALAPLVGRRFVFASEGSEHLYWNTALVKHLTGGDTVSLRRIFGRQGVARPTWTVFLATNHAPNLGLVDDAIRDRLRLVPFDHHVPPGERVPDLAGRLVRQEGPGILNWLLEGLAMVRSDGLGEPPAAVRSLTDEYLVAADDIGRYLGERTVRNLADARLRVRSGALYDDYKAWCGQEGIDPVSLTRFGNRLNEDGYRRVDDTAKCRVRLGIALKVLELETS